jgi:outer membrane biosynthesis protein TonB
MSYRGPLTCFAVLFFLSTIAPSFAAEPKFEPGELLIGYMTSNDRDRAIKKLAGAKDALRVRGERLEGVEAQPIAGNAVKLRLTFSAHVLSARRNNPSEEVADLQEVAKQLKETDPSVQYAHPNWIAEVRAEPPSGAKAQETKAKETKAQETKAKETKAQETKAQETKAQETKTQETKETKAQETKAKETKAQETKAQETKAQETKAKETTVKETKAKEASPHPHRRVASVHRSSRHKHSHAATRLAFEHHHHRHHGGKQPQWWGYDRYWTFSFSSSCWDWTKGRPKGHHSHGQCRRDAMR